MKMLNINFDKMTNKFMKMIEPKKWKCNSISLREEQRYINLLEDIKYNS